MKKAVFLTVCPILLTAFFIALPVAADVLPSPLGTLISTQSDQSVTQNLATGGGQASATSTAGFSGVELSTLHLLIQENGTAGFYVGTGSIKFFSNTACSGANVSYDAPDATIPAGSGFADIYIDLRNIQATADATVKCITVGENGFMGIGKNAKYNAAGDTPYFELYANALPDWNAISFPAVFSTTSAAIAASSSLWGAYATSSQLAAQCTTGNVFADAICEAFSFVFVPNPNVLSQWALLPQVILGKFPFSWFTGIQTTYAGLVASTTPNFLPVAINFHDAGVGSTTPFANLLPNVTVLSTTTISTYIPTPVWNFMQGLIAFALWLGLADFIFFEVRNEMHKV